MGLSFNYLYQRKLYYLDIGPKLDFRLSENMADAAEIEPTSPDWHSGELRSRSSHTFTSESFSETYILKKINASSDLTKQ
jgi:hypothetical protein